MNYGLCEGGPGGGFPAFDVPAGAGEAPVIGPAPPLAPLVLGLPLPPIALAPALPDAGRADWALLELADILSPIEVAFDLHIIVIPELDEGAAPLFDIIV